ncbi:MAG: hypothetical protein IKW01_02080, partial [Firmicutes bacterium]|nr:hypothetical protein [Bacillota bacterium]
MNLKDSVTTIKGVGIKRAQLLEKLNIRTVEDMLYCFPHRYEDRRKAVTIMEAPFNQDVLLEVKVVKKQIVGGRMKLLKVLVEDNTGNLELLFFNARFLAGYFSPGEALTLFGRINLNKNRRQMSHPEFHKTGSAEDVRGLFPVYPLTEGLSQNQMRAMQMAVRKAAGLVEEWLPEDIVEKYRLCDPGYAIENIHFPLAEESVKQGRFRLVFEELLVLQTGLFYIKHNKERGEKGVAVSPDVSVKPFLDRLPFKLTEGQERAY